MYHLIHLGDRSLAGQIVKTQRENNFPGLYNEVQDIVKELNLDPNLIKYENKKKVRKNVLNACHKKN